MTLDISQLHSISRRAQSTNFSRSDSSSILLEITNALGWSGDQSVNHITAHALQKHTFAGSIGHKIGIVISSSPKSKLDNSLRETALYSYHADSSWGSIVTSEGITIFNPRWISENKWYKLKTILWTEIDLHTETLSILQPDNMINNQSENIALKKLSPDGILPSVDDALVNRLEYWRYQTLRYIKASAKTDEQVQQFFAQLFVFRMLEDRHLIDSIGSLANFIDTDLIQSATKQAFSICCDSVSNELFNKDIVDIIPLDILNGIIKDLYYPSHLPSKSQLYNFSWIDADLLGATYEKYLGTIYSETPLSLQPALFLEPERELQKSTVRKQSGSYYTPSFLVDYIVERAFKEYYFNREVSIENLPKVADIACGSGSFLLSAAKKILDIGKSIDPKLKWSEHIVQNKLISGIDIDERATNLARLSLWIRFAQENNPLPLPHLSNLITTGDSLSSDFIEDKFDILLGNPPFIANPQNINVDYGRIFHSAKGRFDFSYLFVEQAINHLNKDGILGFVLPNRIFKNRDAASIRAYINQYTRVFETIDFNSSRVFKDVSAYIGVLMLKKSSRTLNSVTKFINVLNIKNDFVGKYLRDASKSEFYYMNDIESFDSRLPVGDSPWLFISPSEQKSRIILDNSDYTIGSLCDVFQGIKTGANDIFVIVPTSFDESSNITSAINGFGESLVIETNLLKKVAFGSDLQKFTIINSNRMLVYPYMNDESISLQDLETKYPLSFSYLSRYRDILKNRSGIDTEKWHELTRKRDQTWLGRPKIAMKDLGRETQFAIDLLGDSYIIGGTIVVPSDEAHLKIILGYLNSNIANNYLSRSAPVFRGNFIKIEPNNIKNLPIPSKLIEDEVLFNRMNALVDAAILSKNESLEISIVKDIEKAIQDNIVSGDTE